MVKTMIMLREACLFYEYRVARSSKLTAEWIEFLLQERKLEYLQEDNIFREKHFSLEENKV